jgi:hypothetical protein
MPGSASGIGLIFVLAALACVVGASLMTGTASAAPTHPFLEDASLDGSNTPSGEFDKACGVSVDDQGDVYVSNSANGSIDVFSPSGTYLTSIADAEGPCDLAVDSKGNVYVVDTVSGDVVKYVPQGGAYPPTAGLAYEAPVDFEASGEASSVAVNLTNDRVYVANPGQVNVYNSNGTLFQQNEIQRYRTIADGGTYTLSLASETTAPIPAEASLAQVKEALEGLAAVGPGDVEVTGFPPSEGNALYTVTFENGLANTDVPTLQIDPSGLTFSKGAVSVERPMTTQPGFDGHMGEGILTAAFGVDVWGASGQVYVADEGGAIYVFNATASRPPVVIDGSDSPVGTFGALPEANVAVDQRNGHVLVSDVQEAGAVYEFEAGGSYLTTISSAEPDLQDADPTDLAVDPSAGSTEGRVYVTSGPGPGADVFAFGPLPIPTHPALPERDPDPSETAAGEFKNPCGVAIDSQGNLYVTNLGTLSIDIFRPEGNGFEYLTSIADPNEPCVAAVDSEGNLYVSHPTASAAKRKVLMYEPNGYPFVGTPTYATPVVIDPGAEFFGRGLAVNPVNQHLFVTHSEALWEYDSAAGGSELLRDDIGLDVISGTTGVDICAKTGNVFVGNNVAGVPGPGVYVLDPATNEVLTIINGSNAVSEKPDGGFGGLSTSQISVDQADCHVYVSTTNGAVYEFEESGAFVSQFVRNSPNSGFPAIAVDNSGGPNARNIFVAGGINGPPSVNVYEGPAQYGGPPVATVSGVSAADGDSATLEGTVNPGGVGLSACDFEYVEEASFESEGFVSATKVPCVPNPEGIGNGEAPVAVHADISGLDSTVRYRFRLSVANSFGPATSSVRVFGPPIATADDPSEVLYTEAVLDADVDPSGLPTQYHFEYGLTEAYGQSTAVDEVDGEAPITVQAGVFGLTPDAEYFFRVVATNSIGSTEAKGSFVTQVEADVDSCPNASLRTGLSAKLPDCRAYELVTPPDMGGHIPVDLRAGPNLFPAPMSSPNGDNLMFYTEGSLAGTDGNGVKDGYLSTRGAGGWTTQIAGPNGVQVVAPALGGITPQHDYAFWATSGRGGTLDVGGQATNYLRHPDGSFELVGRGPLGDDPRAEGRWISPGGGHVVFTSETPLTADAPPAGTTAIYDRAAGGTAHLVSLEPGDVSPGAGDDAAYQGTSADGSSVAFTIGSTLYLRHGDETFEVEEGDLSYAGFSADGTKLVYVVLPGPTPFTAVHRGEAFVFDTDTGTSTPIGSGGESVVVNVSASGSRVFFSSRQQLDGGEGVPGEENLYVWDGSIAHFIGILDSEDIESTGDQEAQRLGIWVRAIGPEPEGLGWAADPSRANADGSAFVFESAASLTPYDSEGHVQIYRYDSDLDDLDCVSCPGGPATSDASLQTLRFEVLISPAHVETQIPNVSEDGSTVFFETEEGLVPQDQNEIQDVYEWKQGEVSLISSGLGETASYLYAASPDGDDVFISTYVSLLPVDLDGGASSIYDARVGGGFPTSPPDLPCQGDGCKGAPAPPPGLPSPASSGLQDTGNVPPEPKPRKCPKGKRKAKRGGKVVCVKKHKPQRAGKRRGPTRGKGAGR